MQVFWRFLKKKSKKNPQDADLWVEHIIEDGLNRLNISLMNYSSHIDINTILPISYSNLIGLH